VTLDAETLCKSAVGAVKKCGNYARRMLNRQKTIEIKSSLADVVTSVDKAVQRRLVGELLALDPKSFILAEESVAEYDLPKKDASRLLDLSCATSDAGLKKYGRVWILDPLDGTTNYSHCVPIFAISLGLLDRGRPAAGIVHAPCLGEMFYAVAGKGAYMNGKRIRTSPKGRLKDALAVTGYPYTLKKHGPAVFSLLDALSLEVQETRAFGTAALELAYVAAGRLDLYWEVGLKPWDTAAGTLLVAEAGGLISDFAGRQFDNFKPEVLACSSQEVRDGALEIIKKTWTYKRITYPMPSDSEERNYRTPRLEQ
jgi:myo-inositol-1(or 4)-monophosphatase